MEITPNVHQIEGVTANTFLIVEPEGLTLIDCGLPRSEGKILAYIAGLGRSPQDLQRIVITHADADHYGALPALQGATPAQTFAGAGEAEAVRAGGESRPLKLNPLFKALMGLVRLFVRTQPCRVDRVLHDGDELPVLGGLRVVATPGHTPGHISLYAPAAGVLFCGDSLRVAGGEIRVSAGMNTWDEAQARASAARQAALDPAIVCAGHGAVVTGAQTRMASFG